MSHAAATSGAAAALIGMTGAGVVVATVTNAGPVGASATITFAGNFSGRTQTLPLAVYETLQSDHEGALLLSLLLLMVSLLVLIGLRGQLSGRLRA